MTDSNNLLRNIYKLPKPSDYICSPYADYNPVAKTITKKIKKKSAKPAKASKSKTKKQDPKKLIEALKAIPGVGAKSAEAVSYTHLTLPTKA